MFTTFDEANNFRGGFYLFFFQKLEEEKEVPVDDLNNPPADVPGEKIVTMVTKSVDSIMKRLWSLTNFDDADSKVRKSEFYYQKFCNREISAEGFKFVIYNL